MPEQGVFVEVSGFGLVHDVKAYFIIEVKQDGFQSWVVYRDYESFQTLEFQVLNLYYDIDPLPLLDINNLTITALDTSRSLLNDWLLTLLSLSEVFSTQFLYIFLCSDANIAPLHFEALFPSEIPHIWSMTDAKSDISYSYDQKDTFDDEHKNNLSGMQSGGNLSGFSSRSYNRRTTFDEEDVISLKAGKVDVLFNDDAVSGDKAPTVNLDSFTLIRVLGKGSFGKVFLCNYVPTNKLFALKVLSKEYIKVRNQITHTLTEREVLTKVRHPYVIGLVMAFQTPKKLFFVLEYCPGGELFHQLSKVGRFSEGRAKFYAGQVILALAHIHSFSYIYRCTNVCCLLAMYAHCPAV